MKKINPILLGFATLLLIFICESCSNSSADFKTIVETAKKQQDSIERTTTQQVTFSRTPGGSGIGQSVHNFNGMDYLIINLAQNSVVVVNLTKDELEVKRLKLQLLIDE